MSDVAQPDLFERAEFYARKLSTALGGKAFPCLGVAGRAVLMVTEDEFRRLRADNAALNERTEQMIGTIDYLRERIRRLETSKPSAYDPE